MLESASVGSASPFDLPPAAPVAAASHDGLSELDPWFYPPPLPQPRGLVFPFGLSAAAETLEVIAIALIMFLGVRTVAQNFVVDGRSMDPTFEHGDFLIVNKLAYRSFNLAWLPGTDNETWRPFGDPQQGDVIVFHAPGPGDRDFIKRVVAIPGETVEVRDGFVYLDGVAVEVHESVAAAPSYSFGPELVPDDKLFVLGDNRNNSFDSHSWGMLERSEVIGRAELVYWPLTRVGRISHQEGEPVGSPQLSGALSSP